MSAWLDAWVKNAQAIHDRYGITISRQSDTDPQQQRLTSPKRQLEKQSE